MSAHASSPSSTAGGTGQDRRARIRDQMREFYQYDRAATDSSSTGHASPPAAKRGAVLSDVDLDSETFDVQKYTTVLLKKASLKTLVETDTELIRSIRSLDGQLQDLVYKNYAKFISATDTIRHMKENVSDMDTKLKALTTNVEHIDRVAHDVSEHLQPHRAKLEEMLVANRMLRKVQFLVELPETLENLRKARNYHLAVRFWVAGDSVLTKHRNIAAFERARGTCIATAKSLYRELEQTLVKLPLLDADATSIARSIIEDMRLMRSTSLWSQPEANAAPTPQGATPPSTDPSSFYHQVLSSLLESSAVTFTSDVEGVAKRFHAVVSSLPSSAAESLGDLDAFVRDAPVREALNKLDEVFDTFTSSSERCVDLMRTLSDSVDVTDIQHRIAHVAQPALLRCIEWVGEGATSLTTDVLQRALTRNSHTSTAAAPSTPAGVRDTLASVVNKAFKHVRVCIHAIKVLAAQLESQSYFLQGGSAAADLATETAVRKVLHGSATELRRRVDAALVASDGSEDLLRLALVARLVPKCGIPEIAIAVSGEPAAALAQPFSDVCRMALQGFCCSEGRRLIAAHRSIVCDETNAMTVSTPPSVTGVSAAARALRSALLGLAATLTDFFPPDKTIVHHRVVSGASTLSHNSGGSDALGPSSSVKSSARSADAGVSASTQGGCVMYTRHEHQSLLSEVDRALSKASALLVTTPSKDIDSYILEGVTLFVVKGLVEEVRAQVRVRNAKFQQIQVDATCLLLLLPQLSQQVGRLKREAVLAAQLHELGMSAYDRTQDRNPLPSAAVSRLALVVD